MMANANEEEGGYYECEREDALLAAVRSAVSKNTFKNQQFITCNDDECFGTPWQKEVCHVAQVNKYVQQFWNTKGMAEARTAMNRRRQNTATAMKKTFMGMLKETGALSHLLTCV